MLYPLAPSSFGPESVDTATGTALFATGGAGSTRLVFGPRDRMPADGGCHVGNMFDNIVTANLSP